jgi:hypothetical protein
MREIIAKLSEMGVTANAKQINRWLSEHDRGLGTLTDGDIIQMAQDLKPTTAIAKTSSKPAAVQQQSVAAPTENIYSCGTEFEAVGEIDYQSELAAVEQIGKVEGDRDAALLFEAHQRGYAAAFNGRLQQHRNFRQSLFSSASRAIKGA